MIITIIGQYTPSVSMTDMQEKEKDIPKKERYVMRKDRAGEVLDKLAMEITSRMLGHSRINVIAQSYLYHDEN